jgi:signal transduction histidine kinase
MSAQPERAQLSGTRPRGHSVRSLVHDRLYADRALVIDVDVPDTAVVRAPPEDLEEMLGNLLDNACKWASRRVDISASAAVGTISVVVDDDGPGLEPSMRQRVLQRGVRADEGAPGSGLGLAIARDLAEAYGGSVTLDRSCAGGVRARLTLPPLNGGAAP